jgi:hypothetical protein
MVEFDVDPTPLYVFKIDDEYLFSEYFDHTDLFEQLVEYYDDDTYRFEVPAEEFDEVQSLLEEFYYDPVIVDEPAAFCVVKPIYAEHAMTLKQSVLSWERDQHRFFLMKSPLTVDDAVKRGATRLADTDYVLGL